MKHFISFCLLALVAAQASARYVVSESAYDVVDYQELENYISITEIWNKIKSIFKTITDAVTALKGKFKSIVESIKKKIKEIIGDNSASKLKDILIAQLKKLVGKVTAKVQACIDKQNDKIMKIAKDAEASVKLCTVQAQDKLDKIIKEGSALKNIIDKAIADAKSEGTKCSKNPITAVKCLSAVLQKLVPQSAELQASAASIVGSATSILTGLTSCAYKIRNDAISKVAAISVDVTKCAAS